MDVHRTWRWNPQTQPLWSIKRSRSRSSIWRRLLELNGRRSLETPRGKTILTRGLVNALWMDSQLQSTTATRIWIIRRQHEESMKCCNVAARMDDWVLELAQTELSAAVYPLNCYEDLKKLGWSPEPTTNLRCRTRSIRSRRTSNNTPWHHLFGQLWWRGMACWIRGQDSNGAWDPTLSTSYDKNSSKKSSSAATLLN